MLDPGERAERDIALSIIEGQAFCNGSSDERLAAIEPVRVTLLAAPKSIEIHDQLPRSKGPFFWHLDCALDPLELAIKLGLADADKRGAIDAVAINCSATFKVRVARRSG